MTRKQQPEISYDSILKYLPGLAWLVLAILGWSLSEHVNDFKAKLTTIESEIGQAKRTAVEDSKQITELATDTRRTGELVRRIDDVQRRNAERLTRVEAKVEQLVEGGK